MTMTYSIGIDIGGTNTDIGLVSSEGRCVARKNLPTAKYYDADLYVADICKKIKEMMAEQHVDAIDGIGIAAPMGNYYTGCIENATNLNFKGVTDLNALVHKYMDVPVTVSNDANAAAYGELVYGGAKGMKNFITFTLGTGVGSGIVIDGKLLHGKTGNAGELGHVIMIPGGRQCGCGRKGCLETYVSATGIRRTAIEILEQNPDYDGPLSKIPKEELTSKDVGDAANAGDPLAIKIFELVGEGLGVAMANAVAFSSPEAIFLMGGPVKAGEVLMRPVRESFKKHLCFVYDNSVEVRVSELSGNDVAILGAAALTKAK
ncbi:MAG: ROK family protein [Bacteroidales bacterium]|nr:ROK family protein [Bacteroidales bacterium]